MALQFNPFTGTLETKADNVIARWNANKLNGVPIPATTPGFKQSLVYNQISGFFDYQTQYKSISVLEYIPVLLHLAIFNRTSTTDVSSYINAAINDVAVRGGTITFPDGTFAIASPIILKKKVSLKGDVETATIKALPSFSYVNVTFPKKSLVKTDLDDSSYIENIGIKNLTLDGNNVAEHGIEVIRGRFCSFRDLDIIGCTIGGFFSGTSNVSTTYELRFYNIWIWRKDFLSSAESVGFCLRNTTDSYPTQIIVIGYRTGFKSFEGGAGNHFVQCHSWNRPVNGSLKYAFFCGGLNDVYNTCYADTPNDGANPCYGFYVDYFSQRIINSFVYMSAQVVNGVNYGVDNTAFGIFCSENSGTGSKCVFSCNTFYGGSPLFRLKEDIGGQFFLALLSNNTSENCVLTQPDRAFKGIFYTTGGNTGADIQVRDDGGTFVDNFVAFNSFPSGNNSSSATVPGSVNKASMRFFRQTSTVGAVNFEIYDGAATFNGGQRATPNIAHNFSGNALTPSYTAMYQNFGFGMKLPGAKVQINGGLVVANSTMAVGDPGAGNIRTGGIAFGYSFVSTSGNVFSSDYYVNADASAGNIIKTLPAANGVTTGRTYVLKKVDASANTVTLAAQAGNTIEGAATKVLTTQYESIKVYTAGGSTWFIA